MISNLPPVGVRVSRQQTPEFRRAIEIARAALRPGLGIPPVFPDAELLSREFLRLAGLPTEWRSQ